MGFVAIEKTRYLSVKQAHQIRTNFQAIYELLLEWGVVSAVNIATWGVSYTSPLNEVLKFFNSVENDIHSVHGILKENGLITDEWPDKYYKDFTWTTNTKNKKQEVWRWIDWMNDVNSHLFKLQKLQDIDGNDITDINGNIILVTREDA